MPEQNSITRSEPNHDAELVLYFDLDGSVSVPCRIVDTSLRNGRVVVSPEGSTKRITVHKRRLLPLDAANTAQLLSEGDKHRVFCPKCGAALDIMPGALETNCPEHGTYPLYSMGAKPMAIDETTKTKKTAPKKTTPKETVKTKVTKPQATPKATPVKEVQAINIDTVAGLGALYHKPDATFNHPNVSIAVYTLITDKGRKHCFNTYNGSLGRRTKDAAAAITRFQDITKGFPVKDLAKEQAALAKANYVLVNPDRKAPNQDKATANGAPDPEPIAAPDPVPDPIVAS